ncbi:coiled-coil domain-containing protein 167 [Thalassophryne amazonica]|uniref:coiled-coil domain-containing protein 167 n=1 Tax=Thalassophryne amazonica TaxID=390379 RepID=UPI001471FD48|nr:coiled-coil domain-containing protein 167 [Thalassophryne amazonica]
MAKFKDKKRDKISVASEIDRVEEQRAHCQENLEWAEFRSRREKHSEKKRQQLADELSIITDRLQKLDKELQSLRGENRRNMLLSLALLAVSVVFYYLIFENHESS